MVFHALDTTVLDLYWLVFLFFRSSRHDVSPVHRLFEFNWSTSAYVNLFVFIVLNGHSRKHYDLEPIAK